MELLVGILLKIQLKAIQRYFFPETLYVVMVIENNLKTFGHGVNHLCSL